MNHVPFQPLQKILMSDESISATNREIESIVSLKIDRNFPNK